MRCRHAVAAGRSTATTLALRYDDTQDLYTLDLSPGNTVDAFEELGERRRAREFLDPAQMRLAVTYPEPPVKRLAEPPGGERQRGASPAAAGDRADVAT